MRQAEKMCGNVYMDEMEYDMLAEEDQDYLMR